MLGLGEALENPAPPLISRRPRCVCLATQLRRAFRELFEPLLAGAIEPGALGLGWRLTDLLHQPRLDPAAILAGDSLAQAVEPLMDLVPNETLLLRDGQRALGKSDEVGDMPLLRLATNLHGFN